MRYREHRGGLDDSLETTVEIADREALVALIRERLAFYKREVNDQDVYVRYYSHDRRAWGDTYIVTLTGYGVLGFTDEPAACR